MIKKIVYVLIALAIIKTIICNILCISKDYNKYKSINGTIAYIKNDKDKTIMDINSNHKVRITLYNNNFKYNLGDKVIVRGIFKNVKNNTVFNTFKYDKYLLSKNIKYISINPKVRLVKENNNLLYGLKNKIINKIKKYKTYDYLNSFVLGDSSLIQEDIKENYRIIGISHLFSVSGMHIGLIVFVIDKVIRKNKAKYILIFFLLCILLFLTNYTESLLRCFVFLILSHINKKLKLDIKTEEILLLAASFLLLYNSYFIYSIGFLFSFIITFFIIISKKLISGNYVFKTLKLSVICFLASIPIISYSFYTLNLLSPIFNTILIPIVSFVIFPIGILELFIPQIDSMYLLLIKLFEWVVNEMSKITIFTFVISKPCIIIVILYYIVLFLSLKRNMKYILLFILILIININSKYLIFKPFITFLDVGQGDSNVVILPKGKTIVIDTGGNVFNDNIVKYKTKPFLNSMGINKIDYLILSHGDYDHMGEAINLVNNFKVEKVIFNCGPFNDLEKDLIKVLDKKEIKYYSCIEELNIDNNKLYFLQTKEYDNENDNSSVIYTELDGYKFMFMGDASITTEKEILNKYNLSNIDVLKVGHHGSKTSSSINFINQINPKYSIISVGKNNRYGHPNKEVLKNLNQSTIYRTDQDGSIMFKINNKLKIETCSP